MAGNASMENERRILVVGAAGGVGRRTCKEVCRQFGPGALVVGDCRAAQGQELARALGKDVSWRFVDVNHGESIKNAVADVDAVIVAAQQKEPLVQAVCAQYRIVCLDITFSPDFVHKVERLQEKASSQGAVLVAAAGLFPGLSGIMAKYACECFEHVESIDVGMLQNTNGSAGPTGIADMLGLFAQPATFRKNGAQQLYPGFTVKREFAYPEPFGRHKQRLINFYEASVVAERCHTQAVNYWTGFDKSGFNGLLAVLNEIGILCLFNSQRLRMGLARTVGVFKGRTEPQSEPIAVTVEVSGTQGGKPCGATVSVTGPSDYGTTAMCVVAMAKLILNKCVQANGVCFPMDIFSLHLLLDAINSKDVALYESPAKVWSGRPLLKGSAVLRLRGQ